MFEEQLGGELYTEALSLYRDTITAVTIREWQHYGQCIRAAGSVVANIAEANGRIKKDIKYYQNFMLHSRGSAFEVLAWLQMGDVEGLVSKNDMESIGKRLMSLGDLLLKEAMRDHPPRQGRKDTKQNTEQSPK